MGTATPPDEPLDEGNDKPPDVASPGQEVEPQADDLPRFIEHPISYLSWWLTKKQPSNIATLLLGTLGALVAAGLIIGIGYLISLIVGAGDVPAFALAIAVAVGLLVGAAPAWRITRSFYRLRIGLADSNRALKVQDLEHQLLDKERELSELTPDLEALRRLGVYSDHMDRLLESLMQRTTSLDSLSGDEAKRDICAAPQALMRKHTGQEYFLSIWAEGPAGFLRGGIHKVAGVLPGVTEEQSDRLLRFQILCAPDHTEAEREAFSVSVDASWLKWNHRQEQTRQEKRVYQVDKLPFVGLPGDDLAAFEQKGYRSVRATSIQRDGPVGYLVLLAKAETAFSQIEERFLLWLRHAIELDDALRREAAQ